jgi:hypothetical protein
MKKKYSGISINVLSEIVSESETVSDVVTKLGLNPKLGNIKKNVERLIKRNNISIEHFTSIKRLRDSKLRYEKSNLVSLIKNHKTFKEILCELDLLPITSNYIMLKKHLDIHNIDYSHIKIKTNIVFDEKNLKKVIIESNSLNEALLKLGLNGSTYYYRRINELIKKYNIDISHLRKGDMFGGKIRNKIPTIDILVINSKYCSTSTLKERLYREGLKNRKCELCGQNEMWMGNHISMILDHINGINNDNRLENLRIVCPNCNAGLSTHCGKNINKDNINYTYCKCGKKIKNGSKLCRDCNDIKTRKVERPTQEQLLTDINELGYCGTGRKYGVSDNAVGKWHKCGNSQ